MLSSKATLVVDLKSAEGNLRLFLVKEVDPLHFAPMYKWRYGHGSEYVSVIGRGAFHTILQAKRWMLLVANEENFGLKGKWLR